MARVILIALDDIDTDERRLKAGDEVYLETEAAARAVMSKKFCYASQFSEKMLPKKMTMASDTPKPKPTKAA